ncbi:MAG: flagellar motor protein MotB [Rickettsiales bacterium]
MAAKGKDDAKRPIIIKKVKKVAGGHHGGAWKVAYADFVTAMMAFFLLLWLLSSASKETLQALSEYFTPVQGITGNIGIKDAGGESPDLNGKKKSSLSERTIVAGNTPSGEVSENPEMQAKSDSNQDDSLFKRGATSVEQAMTQDTALQPYADNVSVTQTPEGLRIDITDTDKYAMFERSSAVLTVHGQTVLAQLANLIKRMPNFMAIYGHTDASPAETGRADYTNWELSADRAQAARRFLNKSGIEVERAKKVIGMADKELFTPSEPRGPKNRRIALVLLRGSHILIPDAALPTKDTDPAPVAAPAAAAPATPKAMTGSH